MQKFKYFTNIYYLLCMHLKTGHVHINKENKSIVPKSLYKLRILISAFNHF